MNNNPQNPHDVIICVWISDFKAKNMWNSQLNFIYEGL